MAERADDQNQADRLEYHYRVHVYGTPRLYRTRILSRGPKIARVKGGVASGFSRTFEVARLVTSPEQAIRSFNEGVRRRLNEAREEVSKLEQQVAGLKDEYEKSSLSEDWD